MPTAICRNHPERDAIGICVRCQMRVCGECVTRVDGINYCVSCLGLLAKEQRPAAPVSVGTAERSSGHLALGAAFIALVLAAWLVLELALPGRG